MGKYAKLFNAQGEYDIYINGNPYLPNVSYIQENQNVKYNPSTPPTPPAHDYSQDYLTLIMLESGGSIESGFEEVTISNDEGQTWVNIINDLNIGDRILVKGTLKDVSGPWEDVHLFDWSEVGKFNVEGNILSVYDSTGFRNRTTLDDTGHNFCDIFDFSEVVSAENLILPLTALTNSCYQQMFWNCTGLTSAPALPATTLANYCYYAMFSNCTSLTTAPALPATTLAQNCYESMFGWCSSLTTAPALPATTLAVGCYYKMFSNCTSLTTAPELPATTLTDQCYSGMFTNCTSLNYIKCLATDISALQCTFYWVDGVATAGTFVKDATMEDWEVDSPNGIPYDWTVIDAS